MKLMKNLRSASALIAATAGALCLSESASAYSIFFGEDINNSATTRLASTPNANAAQSAFLAGLVGVGTETFESFADGTSAPLALVFPGAGTATLTGGSGVINAVASGTNGAGRYPISGSKYWEVSAGTSGSFGVNFSTPVAAFGFFGVDIGDFGGQLTLTLANGSSTVLNVPNSVGSSGSTDGSVLYFGLIASSADEVFTSIAFNTTTGQGDVFAFDNLTIGSLEQVKQVPEPASIALLGLGLIGMGVARRRKTAA